ncbi:MAG: hypothetical protein J6R99_02925 [Alphaproteobacteria bacterium]|nr:hypothetical protein [Alphaproteobacteria bacterium]MBO7066582.1 hypothetical protein [Alphaproteobacteria bacterium]
MSVITLPWSMEQDRINQIKANSTHVDDNFNTLLNAVNGKLDLDGTSTPTADISMGSHKLTNVAAPTVNADAATKGYVDTAITTATKIATASVLGQVKIGSNVDVAVDGTISVPVGTAGTVGLVQIDSPLTIDGSGVVSIGDASTSQKGVLQLGKTDTTANAAVSAVRNTVITNTVPTTGTDGVIYFVYSA